MNIQPKDNHSHLRGSLRVGISEQLTAVCRSDRQPRTHISAGSRKQPVAEQPAFWNACRTAAPKSDGALAKNGFMDQLRSQKTTGSKRPLLDQPGPSAVCFRSVDHSRTSAAADRQILSDQPDPPERLEALRRRRICEDPDQLSAADIPPTCLSARGAMLTSAQSQTALSHQQPQPLSQIDAPKSPTLPSPSMSPTLQLAGTAAASAAGDKPQSALDGSDDAAASAAAGTLSPALLKASLSPQSMMSLASAAAGRLSLGNTVNPALDLTLIVQAFDHLSPPMKNQLLTQLIHRCSFENLQFVASLVLPCLRRDFVSLFPVELVYQILGHLDLRTISRFQRVCRSWRRVFQSEGAELAVWKRRLVDENFFDDAETTDVQARFLALQSASAANSLEQLSAAHQPSGLAPMEDDVSHDRFGAEPPSVSRPTSPDPSAVASSNTAMDILRRSTSSSAIGSRVVFSGMYKHLYRRHHLIRRNWFLGRYRHISFPGQGPHVVTCLQFDTDKIVSASDDQTIRIYNPTDGSLRRTLEGHEGGVWALQYVENTLVSGSTDRSVRVWDMETGENTHIFDGHTSTVRCLILIMPEEKKSNTSLRHSSNRRDDSSSQSTSDQIDFPVIVTGSRDTTIRVWRLPDPCRDQRWTPEIGAQLLQQHHEEMARQNPDYEPDNRWPGASNPYSMHVLLGHSNSVRAIAGHGTMLISGSYDCTVRAWNIATGECLHVFRGHREKVYTVGYCHELQRAVSGSMDSTVKVWCTRTGVALFNLEGHSSLVGLLELSPQYLISAAADATLRIWSPITGQCLASLTGHAAAITCFHHDPKYNRVVSGSDGGIKVWELSSNGYGTKTSLVSDTANSIIPASSPLANQLAFTQGPKGPGPIYGRFICDVVNQVQGVWRVRMDEKRLVCAVQREEGGTWFEVLDFGEPDEPDVFGVVPANSAAYARHVSSGHAGLHSSLEQQPSSASFAAQNQPMRLAPLGFYPPATSNDSLQPSHTTQSAFQQHGNMNTHMPSFESFTVMPTNMDPSSTNIANTSSSSSSLASSSFGHSASQ